jgi:hypothetical protein
MSVSDVFARIKSALDSAGVGYMLSGSFASASYGAPRSTQDIDFVIAATPSRRPVDLEGSFLFVATAEDVIIAKLEWSKLAQSQRQIEDVAAILRVRGDLLDRVYLEKWIAELGLKREWDDARLAAGLSDPRHGLHST